MRVSRAALLAAAATLSGGSVSVAGPLPPGLTQSGGTVMMQPVSGSDEAPSPGKRPSLIHSLSAADHDLYSKAMQAGDRGDWLAAKGLADQGRNEVARRLITWRYLLDKNSGASFGEIDAFLRQEPEWPLRNVLFERAEHAMPETMAPTSVIAWFAGRTPETGIGKVRLGEALMAEGHRTKGRDMIRQAWIEGDFEPAEELSILRKDGSLLTPEVDAKRLNRLIWRGDLSAARRELSRVDSGAQRVAQVRMALKTNPRAGERMLSSLPDRLKDEPGLMFDRARTLRKLGDKDAVPELLARAPVREMAKIDPGHWWGQLALAARESIEDRDYRTAYRLVSDTGLDEGGDFAEAEFMAGWLALRFLHEPAKAVEHFRKLAVGVSRPISLARAHYWAGRAYEADGKDAAAAREYRLAAENPETYYGQLALARLEPDPKLKLHESPANTAAALASYEKEDLTRAIHVLADLGEERFLRLFAVRYVEVHPDASHIALMASDLVRLGFRDVAVRAAKQASYDGIDLLAYSHPVIPLPAYRGPGSEPEHALVLALIRQETEFNADAVSRVGARGLMQLMPSTARTMARLSGLPYRHAELTTDTRYNIQLGMTELSTDLADWNGSYILAAAAYNAGSGNVKRWIATYGDPRSPNVDPIDWIELIPYSETRNYVQRVIENTQVYRDRLAGHSEPLRVLADLYRPNPPPRQAALPPPRTVPVDVPMPAARPDHAALAPKNEAVETAALAPGIEAMAGVPVPTRRPAAMVTPTARPADIATPTARPTH